LTEGCIAVNILRLEAAPLAWVGLHKAKHGRLDKLVESMATACIYRSHHFDFRQDRCHDEKKAGLLFPVAKRSPHPAIGIDPLELRCYGLFRPRGGVEQALEGL
jgi:hypothetical protein